MHRFKLCANFMGCRCKVCTFSKNQDTLSQAMHRSKLCADRVNYCRKVCTILRKLRQKVKRCIAPNFVPIKLIDGTKFGPFCKMFCILFQSLRHYFFCREWRKLWLFFPAAQSLCRWRKISLCGSGWMKMSMDSLHLLEHNFRATNFAFDSFSLSLSRFGAFALESFFCFYLLWFLLEILSRERNRLENEFHM